MAEEGKTAAKSGKRDAPDEVPPVTIGDTRYEVLHYGKREGLDQNGGYIVAKDAESGKELWKLKVYEVEYKPKGKADGEDIFITSMKKAWFRNRLEIRDEHDRRWTVDLDSRSVV